MDDVKKCRGIFLLILYSIAPIYSASSVQHENIPKKCCSTGYIFNEQLICVNKMTKISSTLEDYEGAVHQNHIKCQYNDSSIFNTTHHQDHHDAYTFVHVPDNLCIENTTNGTKILAKCSPALRHRSPILDLGAVVFWGAQTYMSTNIAHVVLCIVVVVIYLSVPVLGRGLYNRAVVRHNICLMMHGVILQFLGFCELQQNCHFINDNLMIFFWLSLQYFTIATVFWLNVICYDMTLAITRFRWIGGSGNKSAEEKKLFLYGLFTWGGAFIPTLVAALCDYIPVVQKDFIMKPNYLDFRKGPSVIVNVYFFTVPAFTLLLNNILFIFTTFKIIAIQRSAKIATQNHNNMLKQKYFLFLRLYLLMGAPWFFGMLLACLNKLVILKMCRLVQPSLWLLMLVTHKEVVKKIKNIFFKYQRPKCTIATVSV